LASLVENDLGRDMIEDTDRRAVLKKPFPYGQKVEVLGASSRADAPLKSGISWTRALMNRTGRNRIARSVLGEGRGHWHRTDAVTLCVLHDNAPLMGVHPQLRELLSDLRSLAHGCGIIGKFFAFRIANAGAVLDMKEIPHPLD
jgi:hypothetical protein